MTFLGILLILLGIGTMFGNFIIGLIFITLGAICIASSGRRKNQEAQAEADRRQMAADRERADKERERALIAEKKQAEEKKLAADSAEAEKADASAKELWIAQKTQEYMDKGFLPTDAKIKAETEFVLEKAKK